MHNPCLFGSNREEALVGRSASVGGEGGERGGGGGVGQLKMASGQRRSWPFITHLLHFLMRSRRHLREGCLRRGDGEKRLILLFSVVERVEGITAEGGGGEREKEREGFFEGCKTLTGSWSVIRLLLLTEEQTFYTIIRFHFIK